MGPNKELKFNKEIDVETQCKDCYHVEVCDKDKEKRCSNFDCGTSEYSDCQCCIHHYTRYDKEPVPCFHCKWFEPKDK